jgi:hypothetical protein
MQKWPPALLANLVIHKLVNTYLGGGWSRRIRIQEALGIVAAQSDPSVGTPPARLPVSTIH